MTEVPPARTKLLFRGEGGGGGRHPPYLHGLVPRIRLGTASATSAAMALGRAGRGRLAPGPKSPGPGTSTNLLLPCSRGTPPQ